MITSNKLPEQYAIVEKRGTGLSKGDIMFSNDRLHHCMVTSFNKSLFTRKQCVNVLWDDGTTEVYRVDDLVERVVLCRKI